MLWLKAWLQESAIKGPRCVDGGLVREMRLSIQECSQTVSTTANDPVAPGCEAELLTAPALGVPFMNLKTTNTTKNLPPLPQESDYFYDEYIDYPYNETAIKEKEKLALKAANETITITKKPIGNTPTIYAAPNKNKTKNQVVNSPSSSGFTFFGVPLPSLNALLGTSTGRKNDVTPMAQRKSAIINANGLPPTLPEIQTGGFVPIVPGMDGGFKPMLVENGSIGNIYTQTQTILNKSEPLDGSLNTKRQYDVNSTKMETVYEFRATDTVEKVTKKPDPLNTLPENNTNDNETNRTKIEMHNFTETENFEDVFKETIDLPYSTTAAYEQSVLIEEIMEENFTTLTTTELPKQKLLIEDIKRNNSATSLTSLLIPGGQQQHFKNPPGRSTITKVSSPHAPLSSSLTVTDDDLQKKEEIVTEASNDLEKQNQDTSWYFTNYNKTNVESFIGQGFYKSDGFRAKSFVGLFYLIISIFLLLMKN